MPNDVAQLGLYVGVAAGINAVSQIQKKADPAPGLIASGILFGLFSIVGSLWRFDLVKAIAAVMLLGSILIQGAGVFNSLSQIVTHL